MLKSFGCSFVSGVDLKDFDSDSKLAFPYSRLTFPALIAQRLGLEYHSVSRGGAGNLAIMHWLLSEVTSDDIVMVNWTYINRFDYVDTGELWKSILPGQTGDREKFFLQNLHSDLRDQLQTLSCINTVVNYLKSNQIPYFMTYMDHLLTTDVRNVWHNPQSLNRLQSMVSPHLNSFQGTDFVTWSKQLGFPISQPGNHPLEQAHSAAADLLIDQVASLL